MSCLDKQYNKANVNESGLGKAICLKFAAEGSNGMPAATRTYHTGD